MSVQYIKTSPIILPPSDLERLKESKADNLETEKARLHKATKEFESFFMYQLLKTMRKTIPKSPISKEAPFSGEMSKDIFTEMFDMQLAKKMVSGDKNSISGILYHSLEKIIDAKYNDKNKENIIKPLIKENKKSFDIELENYYQLPSYKPVFKMNSKPNDFLPVSKTLKPIKHDQILSSFGSYIDTASKKTSLDPALIISVIRVESNGDPQAVSTAGAKGLMQLIDKTAQDYGVKHVFDPEENIIAGSKYLKDLIDRFGSLRLALAAYNAGPSNVMRYNGIPPFKETEAYVEKVLDTLSTINRTGARNVAKVKMEKNR